MKPPILSESDEPTPQYQGIFTPAPLLELQERGKIEPREFILLNWIQAYTKNRINACWASNKHLAKKVRVQERAVQKMLARLEAEGYVTRVSNPERPDRRTIRVNWEAMEVVYKYPTSHRTPPHVPQDTP